MKMRIALPLLFALLCLTLSALPAVAAPAQTFTYTGGTPDFANPSNTGATLNHGFIVDVRWFCPFSECNVTSVGYYNSATLHGAPVLPVPSTIQWLASGPVPFNFTGGTAGTATGLFTPPLSACQGPIGGPPPAIPVCQTFATISKGPPFPAPPVLQPHGLDWLNLYNATGFPVPEGNAIWSFCLNSLGSACSNPQNQTLILGPNGQISGAPNLSFSISGTNVPEPSSILMLGSGFLGLAGVLRRKLIR